jgi:hypothetical protein
MSPKHYGSMSRESLRRASVPAFIRRMAAKHPELERVVSFDDMTRMAQREGIVVRTVDFPASQRGRLMRLWNHPYILLNRAMTRAEQTMDGMHELCHWWRDDPGAASFYSDGETGGPRDEFADIFAWTVTSPAREHLRGVREQDFPSAANATRDQVENESALTYALRTLRRDQLRRGPR